MTSLFSTCKQLDIPALSKEPSRTCNRPLITNAQSPSIRQYAKSYPYDTQQRRGYQDVVDGMPMVHSCISAESLVDRTYLDGKIDGSMLWLMVACCGNWSTCYIDTIRVSKCTVRLVYCYLNIYSHYVQYWSSSSSRLHSY